MQSVQQATEPLSNDEFLERVLGELRGLVPSDQFRAWFNRISLLRRDVGTIEFGVGSGFQRDWLLRNHLGDLERAVATAAPAERMTRIRVSLDHTSAKHIRTPLRDIVDAATLAGASPVETKAAMAEPDELEAVVEGTGLNPNYTFERFVVGSCNRLSHAAALAIGENPGNAYNPLFIHGNVGLGKTHLLQATCHAILQKRRGARVSYLSCEDFTNRYIRAIQDRALDEFRRNLRSVDVLVIDDVQFLASKERTQEEFFHTFNALFNDQCQIVISSDRSPQQIPELEERLVSRFKWGLVAEMETPNLETRVAIAMRKGQCLGVDIDDEVAHLIAERVDKNIRELEGAVIKVVSVMRLTGQELDAELAADALRGHAVTRATPVNAKDVMDLVTDEYSLTVRDITGKGRTQTVSLPRQIAMFLMRRLTELSLEEIGRHFGNRDHTTVLYAVQKIDKRTQSDRRFREMIDSLAAQLQNGR